MLFLPLFSFQESARDRTNLGASVPNNLIAINLKMVLNRFAPLRLLSLILFVSIFVLSGCATSSPKIFTGFYYNMFEDGQSSKLMKVNFSSKGIPVLLSPDAQGRPGPIAFQTEGSSGGFDLPDHFYVKWQDRGTLVVYESSIDLKGKFPKDMHNTTITFLIKNNMVELYVVLQDAIYKGSTPIGPDLYRHNKVIRIN